METHNYKFSLAFFPFLVVLTTMLQYSCMVHGSPWTWTPPDNGYGSPWPYWTPPYTGQDPSPPPPNAGQDPSPPPPDMGYGSPPPPNAGQDPSPPSPPDTDHDDNSQQAYLDAHNKARAEMGVGKMIWNDTVAAYAQSYANARKTDCLLQHSKNGMYGENIAEGSDSQFSAVKAVKMWVGESTHYHYKSNTCDAGEECGHYTQVVWRKSLRLGCARVECNNGGGVFITCNYDPAGNYVGESPY